jgi:hypothetical protein
LPDRFKHHFQRGFPSQVKGAGLRAADLIEIYNLKNGTRTLDFIDEILLVPTRDKVLDACRLLREGCLCRAENCESCDFEGICSGYD